MYNDVHCSIIYSEKDLKHSACQLRDVATYITFIYTMEYYAAMKKDEFAFCQSA